MIAPIRFSKPQSGWIDSWPRSISSVSYAVPSVVDTTVEFPALHWVGKYASPPDKVCDFLTASEWRFQMEFNPGGSFNTDAPPLSVDLNVKAGTISIFNATNDPLVSIGTPFASVRELFEGNFRLREDEKIPFAESSLNRNQQICSVQYSTVQVYDSITFYYTIFASVPWPTIAVDENDDELWYASPVSMDIRAKVEQDYDLTRVIVANSAAIMINGEQHLEPDPAFPIFSFDIARRFGEY